MSADRKDRRYCPFCRSTRPMWKGGVRRNGLGEEKQQYKCRERGCGRMTVHPLKSRPRPRK